MNFTQESLRWPVAGVLLAIAITSIMDLNGLALFTALVLLPLMIAFWWFQRLSRAELGLVWGRPSHYGLALLYPAVVLGASAAIAWMAGATEVSDLDLGKLGKNFLLMSTTGTLMLVFTEEGFFRGWLWASLRRAGRSPRSTLIWTSLAFSAWHWTWALIESGLDLPIGHALVYLANAALMGTVWGLLRWISGSIIVASVSHAVWNGIAYPLFGAGPIAGTLGIDQTILFDAETGLFGLAVNLLFALALWRWWSTRSAID